MPSLRRYFTTGCIYQALGYSSELSDTFVGRKSLVSSQNKNIDRTKSDRNSLFPIQQIKVTNPLDVQDCHRTSHDAE